MATFNKVMGNKNIISIILFFIYNLAVCQNDKWIHGKIIVKDATPKGVRIINLVNETETTSDIKGEFDIKAKIDDLLIFPSDNLDYQRKIIEKEDYDRGSIIVEMTSKVRRLEEVVITKESQLNAINLGILSSPVKKYTPAQRHLLTARSTSFDAMLNAFSGRTKMLEKELEVEKEEILLSKLRDFFEDEYYIKDLKIEPDHIRGFQLYAVQNKNMASALQSNNKALISFILVQLSINYNLLQQTDKP